MRTLFILFFFLFHLSNLNAQLTLVREAPNDSFDLACTGCRLTVAGVAVTKGQHAVPMNLKKPVAVNLLMWRYYDDILKREVLMAHEPYWTNSVLLLDEAADDEMLSLHLNLQWEDSTGQTHALYLVLAGFTKGNLARLPLSTVYDTDTYSLLRFSAIAQIMLGEDDLWETYDAIEGNATIDSLNTKTGAVSGSFEFTGRCIGVEKLGFFVNGVFHK
jgi:hypothetical protein